MDTKSQNSLKKSWAAILFIAGFIFIAAGFAASFESDIFSDDEEFSYFKSNSQINTEVLRFAKNLQRYYIYFADFDADAAEKTLDEISTYISSNRSLVTENSASNFSNNFYNFGAGNYYSNETSEDYDEDLPEQLYNINLDEMTIEEILSCEKELSDTLENYNAVKEYLINSNCFNYYIYNTQRGYTVATNSENFFNEEIYDAIDISDSMFNVSFNGEYISNSFKNNNLACTITIPVNNQNSFIDNAIEYTKNYYVINSYLNSVYVSVICYAVGLMLLFVVRLFKKDWLAAAKKKYMDKYAKVPFIIKLITLFFSISYISLKYYTVCDKLTTIITLKHYFGVVLYIAFVLCVIILLLSAINYVFCLFKHTYTLKNEPEVKLVASIIRDLKFVFKANNPLSAFLYLVVLIASLTPLFPLTLVWLHSLKLGCLALFFYCFHFAFCVLLLKYIGSYAKLIYYVEQMAKGEISLIPENDILLNRSVKNLNNISTGLQNVFENMLKSERLKTELITNVSHDLKTPLTSIINYISLLKGLDLDNKKAADYIDIVDSKAKRLNILIQDLFEASKLSSGQLELEIMKSDIISLINQTIGELDYKIEQSGIEFKVTTPNPPLLIDIDGQRMWRVFDNLVNNIIKYSPSGSRAYVNVEDFDDRVVITLKNVSNYPLDLEGEELFERFKRGDLARTTEGSGLGLSIAKSIVELHGGTMNIVIDGDLFKTIITLFK